MEDEKNMMAVLRQEFMPRETLNITFNHIQEKLTAIDANLRSLPNELADEFEERFSGRIQKLEKEVEELKAFRWKFGGAMLVIQGLIAFFLESLFKH